ncbi:MAG: hypothetical protein ACJ79A_11480 [Gemmatimonadaceae bacterium]
MVLPPDTPRRVWPLRLMALVLFALGLVPMANLVAPGVGLQWWGQSVRLWALWAVAVVALALLIARTLPRLCDDLPARYERALLRPPRVVFMALVGIAICLLGVFFAWHLFGLEPLTIDELSLQWQGRLLAGGRLFARAEAHPEFFSTTQTVVVGDRWFTHFPFGPAAILSVGIAAGVPWLVNPILAAIGALVVYRFLAATTTEREARTVALLFAISPFVLFMAATQLDHMPALVAMWTAVAALPGWVRAASPGQARRHAAIVGLGLGIAATIRPYDAALCAIVIGLFQLREIRRDRSRVGSLAVQVLAGCVPVVLLLATNAATTGHPLVFAYDALNGHAHRPGFHFDPMGELHTPRRGVFNVSAYLLRLDATLLGWPVPALLLVVAALAWQRRENRWDELVIGLLGALLVGYWYFWGEGRALGPRFLFIGAPIFLLYVARFPGALRDRMRRPIWRRAATVIIPLWIALGWLLPASLAQPNGVSALARRARELPVATRLIDEALAEQPLTNALVFIADGWRARLVARLSALGARPFAAYKIVEHYDACRIQQLLDSAERLPAPSLRARYVFSSLDGPRIAVPLPGMALADQLSFEPDRVLTPACEAELTSAPSYGADYVRYLPRNGTNAEGRLDGAVVYARDFGSRNALLRERFGRRVWYRARIVRENGALRARIEPLAH